MRHLILFAMCLAPVSLGAGIVQTDPAPINAATLAMSWCAKGECHQTVTVVENCAKVRSAEVDQLQHRGVGVVFAACSQP